MRSAVLLLITWPGVRAGGHWNIRGNVRTRHKRAAGEQSTLSTTEKNTHTMRMPRETHGKKHQQLVGEWADREGE